MLRNKRKILSTVLLSALVAATTTLLLLSIIGLSATTRASSTS